MITMIVIHSWLFLILSSFEIYQNYAFRTSLASPNRFSQIYKQSSSDFSLISNDWFAYGDCQILLPDSKVPKSIIHFVGGFLVGSSPSITYSDLLKALANQGHMIVATTIPTLNVKHDQTSIDISESFNQCYVESLTPLIGSAIKNVPIIGLSHSLGGKLMSLMNSNKKLRKLIPKRAGNVYLAFNNYDMVQSIEFSKRKATEQIVEKIPDINQVINTVINAVPNEFQELISTTINTVTSTASGFDVNNNYNNNKEIVLHNDDKPTSTDTSTTASTINNIANNIQNIFAQGTKFIDTINESVESVNIDSSAFLQELDKILLEETSSSQTPYSNPANTITINSYINSTKSVINDNLNSLKNILNITAQAIKNEADASASGRPIGSTFEFSPTPQETWEFISNGYNIQKNILFKFNDDDIDQSKELDNILRKRGCDVVLFEVPGNHLTPNTIVINDDNNINDNDTFLRYLCMSMNRIVIEYNEELLDSQILDERGFVLPSSSKKSD